MKNWRSRLDLALLLALEGSSFSINGVPCWVASTAILLSSSLSRPFVKEGRSIRTSAAIVNDEVWIIESDQAVSRQWFDEDYRGDAPERITELFQLVVILLSMAFPITNRHC